MPRIDGLRRVFRLATKRAPVADDVDAEIAFHFEMTAAELERRGLDPQAARTEARRRFGDVDARRAELQSIDGARDRSVRMREWWQSVAQDVRYAGRGIRMAPGFAAVVVVTLALGIGANSMMFGIVDRLLERPPAYLRAPERTGRIYFTRTRDADRVTSAETGYAMFRDIREGTAGVLDVEGFGGFRNVMGEGARARAAYTGQVSGGFFSLFDARPVVGRFIAPSDDQLPAGTQVTVLGYDYWNSEMGADPSVVGRRIRIGEAVYEVIGVAPKNFTGVGLQRVDAWVPLTAGAINDIAPDFANRYNLTWFNLVGRRKPGVTQATADARLRAAYVESMKRRPDARPITETRPDAGLYSILVDRGPDGGSAARVALWVFGVAGIVLLVACANVANLLLARALRREREIALRVALGAGRARLGRQLLSEVLVLAALGAAAGLLVGRVVGGVVTRVLLPDIAWGDALADGRTLAATAAVAIAAAVLAAMVPALRALRPDVVSRLRSGTRERGGRHGRVRAALVLAQSALSVVLLVGAGLFLRSVLNLRTLDFGYEPQRVLFATVALRGERLGRGGAASLDNRLIERANAMTFAEAVGTTYTMPYYMGFTVPHVRLPGTDSTPGANEVHANLVSGAYFTAMGTRVLRGRVWDPAHPTADQGAVVLSARLARLLWPDRRIDPIGRCVLVDEEATAPCRTVIGVVADVRRSNPHEPGVPGFYLTTAAVPTTHGVTGLVVRTRGDASRYVLELQRALQPLVPGAAYVQVRTVADLVDPELRPWRLGATLFGAFGALALVLAAVGLYGVLAYDVVQRRSELGVRLALGARRADVLRHVLARGVRFAIAGVAVGLVIAVLVGPAVNDLLFDVSPYDPATLALVGTLLVVVAIVAGLIPGRRAARVDPAVTLRAE